MREALDLDDDVLIAVDTPGEVLAVASIARQLVQERLAEAREHGRQGRRAQCEVAELEVLAAISDADTSGEAALLFEADDRAAAEEYAYQQARALEALAAHLECQALVWPPTACTPRRMPRRSARPRQPRRTRTRTRGGDSGDPDPEPSAACLAREARP